MIPSLSQEELTQYASDAQTIQQPQGADYTQGVKAGKTIPAKWWNWLFSASTKRIVQARSDANNMLTELKNVVTDAGLTPSGSDNTQLAQAVEAKVETQVDSYIESRKSFMTKWYDAEITLDGVPLTHTGSNTYYNRYPDINNVTLVAGLYFAAVHGFKAGVNSGAFACSRDLIHWTTVHTSPHFTGHVYSHGAVYFKNAWYALVGTGNYEYILKSTDGINWTDITDNFGSYSGCIATIVNDMLYLIRYPVNTGGIATDVRVYMSQDGATWNYQTLTRDYSVVINEPNRPCVETVSLTGNKYLVGALMLLDFDAQSATPFLQQSTTGRYLVKFNNEYYLSAGYDQALKVSQAGTVAALGYVLDGFSSNSSVLFKSVSTTGTGNNLEYSFDGAVFHAFPDFKSFFNNTTVNVLNALHASDGYWYIAVGAATTPVASAALKVLKAQALSENIADYTVVYQGVHRTVTGSGGDTAFATSTVYSVTEPVPGYLSINGAMSHDGGSTWQQGDATTVLESKVYSPNAVISPDGHRFYGIVFNGGTKSTPSDAERVNLFTINGVNKVIGHTLYLH